MTIGLTFPVKLADGDKEDLPRIVPWGLLEGHRARAIKNHGAPLERLHALGGLTFTEIAAIMSDQDVADVDPEEADTIIRQHLGLPAGKGATANA